MAEGQWNKSLEQYDVDNVEWMLTDFAVQPLDNKTLGRLETAVQKSAYVGQGKKLKVTNEV